MTSPLKIGQADQQIIKNRDLAEFGAARLRDQVFDAVRRLWHRRRSEGWTQKQLAEAIGRDRGWVSKNLNMPGNWTLRTAGELIQALEGEAEIDIVPLEQPTAPTGNYDAYDGYISRGFHPNPRSTIIVKTSPSVAVFDIGQPNKMVKMTNETLVFQSVLGIST